MGVEGVGEGYAGMEEDYFQSIDSIAILWATLYCVVYCALLISFAVSIFMRRDFK